MGVDDPGDLAWIDPPPPGPLAAARRLLTELGALDGSHRITAHGRALARLGIHPRLGQLLLGAGPGHIRLAAEVAAVLSEGDPARGSGRSDADLAARVEMVRSGRAPAVADAARRWERVIAPAPGPRSAPRGRTGAPRPGPVVAEDVALLVALAYPDRVGRRRPDRPGHWLLRSGRGAWVAPTDPLAGSEWIVAAELDGDRRDARIRLGAPLHPDDVEARFGAEMTVADRTEWDPRTADVVARRERLLGAVVVRSEPLRGAGGEAATAALVDGIRADGLGLLPWTPDLDRLRARVGFVRRVAGDGTWPDLTDAALLEDPASWLGPWLRGRVRRADLAGVALGEALWSLIGWSRRAELDSLAPTHLTVPTGERRRLEYPPDGPPWVAVRLQELFGTAETPTVAAGRVPVLLHLTSPAGRPVQVTSDLASFWATTYGQVRAELRARYPRHAWPEDPRHAVPTSRATPRRRR